MLGPFRASAPMRGGLLWKTPWRLSSMQKRRQRKRLRLVDNVVATLDTSLSKLYSRILTHKARQQPPQPPRQLADGEVPGLAGTKHKFPAVTTAIKTSSPAARSIESDTAAGRFGTAGQVDLSASMSSAIGGAASTAEVETESDAAHLRTIKSIARWKAEMPREEDMAPRDKYSIFDRKEKTYRKGIHKLPKWTRVSQRINPPGF